MSTQPRLQPTRRTVLRTAAWTAPAVSIAVAAPAFAAISVDACSVTNPTRNGANFYLSIGCKPGVGAVTSVTIGTRAASWDGTRWHAKMTGVGQIGSTHNVIIRVGQDSVTKTVTFIG
ncbi:hypothetical protein [Nocardioides terrigena]|uniref:hypothetical protein n=1 Tax=Nocardioides terrigena TaxID=424797 RepID=UPI00131ED23F|nr:hypothetical protein [Nocardioides terrigena]